jgi:hypothetical protein
VPERSATTPISGSEGRDQVEQEIQQESEASPGSALRQSDEVEEQKGRGEEESLSGELLAEMDGSELALLLENGETEADEVDLDAFWESAMNEEQGNPSSGLSLEEARERGLIPPEFDESKQ